MQSIPLLRSSAFAFPARRPGFDTSHPAAQNLVNAQGYSGICVNGWLLSLLNSQRSALFAGTPTLSMRSGIGPAINFSSVNNADFRPVGQRSFVPAVATMAAIVEYQTIAAGDHSIISFTGATLLDTATTLRIYNSGYVDSTIPLAVNIPYFMAVSIVGSGVVNFILVNLQTGQTSTSVKSTASAIANPSSLIIGVNGQQPLAYVAAVMWSPIFLSIPALMAWGTDPWAFWYPRSVFSSLDWIKSTAPAVAFNAASAQRGVMIGGGVV